MAFQRLKNRFPKCTARCIQLSNWCTRIPRRIDKRRWSYTGLIATGRWRGVTAALLLSVGVTTLIYIPANLILDYFVLRELWPTAAARPTSNLQLQPIAAADQFTIDYQSFIGDAAASKLKDVRVPQGETLMAAAQCLVSREKGNVPVLVIEFTLLKSENAQRLTADVAYFDMVTSTWRAIDWWETGGIASTNELVRIQPKCLGVMRDLDFPTSVSAVVTWVKQFWPTVSKQFETYGDGESRALPARIWRDNIGPEMDRVLMPQFGGVQSGFWMLGLRVINGWIQFATVVLFISALLVLWRRSTILTLERQHLEIVRVYLEKGVLPASKAILNRAKIYSLRYGTESSVWQLCSDAVGAYRSGVSVVAALEESRGRQGEKVDAQRYFLRFLAGALPAVGFIGTVVGIGLALGSTSGVLSDQIAKQQSGVSAVALELGLAFDTTLVALVLGLLLSFFSSQQGTMETMLLADAKDEIESTLLSSLARSAATTSGPSASASASTAGATLAGAPGSASKTPIAHPPTGKATVGRAPSVFDSPRVPRQAYWSVITGGIILGILAYLICRLAL